MSKGQNQTISVIITVYNVRPYLTRCIESVLSQTYRNLEVLVIDDGSTDGSAAVCDAFARRDNRLHVIRQNNRGPGAARNAGVRKATGRFLFYVDGDDILHPACLQVLMQAIQENKAQIAVCGTQLLYETADKWNVCASRPQCKTMLGSEGLRALLYQKDFDTCVWGKLYLTGMMRQISFPENCIYEDILPSVQMFAQAQKTVLVTAPLYGYLQRADSIMHQKKLQSCLDELRMSDQMYDWVCRHCPQEEAAALHKKYSNYCQVLRALHGVPQDVRQMRETVHDFLQQNAKRIWKDPRARRKNRGAALLMLLSPRLFEKML